MTIIDIIVYSVSGVLTGTGIILSSVTTVAPLVVPIVISAVATIGGVITAITKKISSCSQAKFYEYSLRADIVSRGYLQLSTMISNILNDEFITDEEFIATTTLYNTVTSSLKKNFTLKTTPLLYNNNVIDGVDTPNAPTDCSKYSTDNNNADFNNDKNIGIRYEISNTDTSKINRVDPITSLL